MYLSFMKPVWLLLITYERKFSILNAMAFDAILKSAFNKGICRQFYNSRKSEFSLGIIVITPPTLRDRHLTISIRCLKAV